MTNTRRTSGSPEKKQKEEPNETTRKRKNAANGPPDLAAETSRPKRIPRKSALLTSGDYEVSYPGVALVKEEERADEEYAVDQASDIPEEAIPSTIVRTGRPRRLPPAISPIVHVTEDDNRTELEMSNIDVGSVDEMNNMQNHHDMHMIDIDNLATEVDVETMSNLEELEHDEMMKAYGYIDEGDDQPPHLERASDMKRKRGRPRKYPQGQTPFRRTSVMRPRTQVIRDPATPAPRNKYTYEKPLTKGEAEKINSYNVKLFEDEIQCTENGDVYATVIPGCLSYLLRKERIIDLLTSRSEIDNIKDQGWMMSKPPRLPPLSTQKVCYAFYVDGSTITSIRELSSDDLKPWTTSSNDPAHNEPVVKPNVRKHPIIRQGGRLMPTKGDPRGAEIHLTEYSAWLPRCLRLRKKIFYLARSGHIIGNVLILYDFTQPGDIPILLNVVHGNEAFRGSNTDEEFERGHLLFVGDNENPFEEEIVPGPRGEKFLQVKHDRYGWTNNKKLLLRWLVNDPELLEANNALNPRIPYLPPLIEERGVFVFFAPANIVADQIHFTGDGLSPWTFQGASVNHRVRTVKKALVQDSNGFFHTSKEDWQVTGLALVETITILCRCPRLRKRIIYVQKSNALILGNICYIYEYMQPGPLPEILKTNNRASSASIPVPESMIMRSNQVKTERMMNEDDIDVEELVEEVVGDDLNPTLGQSYQDELPYEELPEDSLNGGWDTEFEEDVLVSQESSSPFFEGVRHLEDGHTYLTVRHKRVLCNTDTILEFIANSNFVDEKGLMNTSKPSHPPLVRNARAYVFFVSGHVIFPHDINRDDFSPWSANATPDRPTCYRSKVRKFGCMCDPKTGRYVIQPGDYKQYPFHLVSLYSIHPKEDRLRKRIHYLMDSHNRSIISHVMIMYDYNQEGMIPRINGPYGKRMIRRRPIRRLTGEPTDVLDDISDESESEKPSPFAEGIQTLDSGEMYLTVEEPEFINDRNRQLNYLINKPHIVQNMGCVNQRVPQFPPLIPGRGVFVFFIDSSVDNRMLTCDGLGPWSENVTLNDGSIMQKRPKTHRVPAGLNRLNQVRILRGKKFPTAEQDFQYHLYVATLPRCSRLKKRVVYITRDNAQIGMSMIMYMYTEDGEIPQPVTHGNAVHSDNFYIRIPPNVKEEARQMLSENIPIADVIKELTNKHNFPIHPRSIHHIKRELLRETDMNDDLSKDVKLDGSVGFGEDSMADYVPPDWMDDRGNDDDTMGRRLQPARIHLDPNQLFRYVKNVAGCRTDAETFDTIWKALVMKDEHRILRNIKTDFGVEIVADRADRSQLVHDDGTLIHEEILEGEIVSEQILTEGDIIEEEVVMEDVLVVSDRVEEVEAADGLLLQDNLEVPEMQDNVEEQETEIPKEPAESQ